MTVTAESLNRSIARPDSAWFLDFRPSHLIAAGIDEPQLALQAAHGPTFSLVHGGRIVAVFGFVILWHGVAEAWMHATPHVRAVGMPFSRQSRKLIDSVALSLALRRVQIHVHTANAPAARWARLAGFVEEARLSSYTADGQDVYLMSRLYGGKDERRSESDRAGPEG